MIYNIGIINQRKERMENISPREAKEKLANLRFQFQTDQISLEEAYLRGEPYRKIYNDFAIKTAKKYGVRPSTIKNNIICW